jgi:hypothetical protein
LDGDGRQVLDILHATSQTMTTHTPLMEEVGSVLACLEQAAARDAGNETDDAFVREHARSIGQELYTMASEREICGRTDSQHRDAAMAEATTADAFEDILF